MIRANTLTLDDIEVKLTEGVDIMSLSGSVRNDSQNSLRRRWPWLESHRQVDNSPAATQLLVNDFKISQDTELAGYENPHAAVRTLLGIDFSSSNSPGGLWVTSDIPMRLLEPQVKTKDKELQLVLQVESHPRILDVSCTVRIFHGNRTRLLQQSVTQLTRSAEASSVATWSGNAAVSLGKDDEITLEILYSRAGKLRVRCTSSRSF